MGAIRHATLIPMCGAGLNVSWWLVSLIEMGCDLAPLIVFFLMCDSTLPAFTSIPKEKLFLSSILYFLPLPHSLSPLVTPPPPWSGARAVGCNIKWLMLSQVILWAHLSIPALRLAEFLWPSGSNVPLMGRTAYLPEISFLNFYSTFCFK